MMVRGSCCSGHTVTVTVIAILLQLAVLLSLQIATTADTETVSNGIVSLTVDLKKGEVMVAKLLLQ